MQNDNSKITFCQFSSVQFSYSVVSNSLQPHGLYLPDSSVYGILQARIRGWVAIPFSRGSSWPRDWTQISCIAGRFFTVWTTRETHVIIILSHFIHFFFWGFWYFFVVKSVFFLMAVYEILGINLHLKTIKNILQFSYILLVL